MEELKNNILEQLQNDELNKNRQEILRQLGGIPMGQLSLEVDSPTEANLKRAIIELYNDRKIKITDSLTKAPIAIETLTSLEQKYFLNTIVRMEEKELAERRIQDWKNRILSLYESITEWTRSADDNYQIRRDSSVLMYEELMQKYLIKSEELQVLDIYYGKHIVITFKPIGLWIIGANGRVDILYKNGSVILVDRAKQFQNAIWTVFSPQNKKDGQAFSKDYFIKLLRSSI